MPKLKSEYDAPAQRPLAPFWSSACGGISLFHGPVLWCLRQMPTASVQCVVTSPPYFQLRRYDAIQQLDSEDDARRWADEAAAEWNRTLSFDGTARYIPRHPRYDSSQKKWIGAVGTETLWEDGWWSYGNEDTIVGYVGHTVEVFRGLRRVLRDDGIIWWNVMDTFASSGGHRGQGVTSQRKGRSNVEFQNEVGQENTTGLPTGSLCLIPEKVRIALQEDGWVVRSVLPWCCRNKMPESADGRPGRAIEDVIMLVKESGYYSDMEAVRTGRNWRNADLWFESIDTPHGLVGVDDELVGLDVTLSGYSGQHYASYSFNLIRPLIQFATSERGCCAECGAPWRRVVEKSANPAGIMGVGCNRQIGSTFSRSLDYDREKEGFAPKFVGWEPTCECRGRFVLQERMVERPISVEDSEEEPEARDRSLESNRNGRSGSLDGVERPAELVKKMVKVYESALPPEEHPVKKCVVLDCFTGTGSTQAACYNLGRASIGIEISQQYLAREAVPRLRAATGDRRHLVPPPRRKME